MTQRLAAFALGAVLATAGGLAAAQDNILKAGPIRYTTNSKTSGITGPGLPVGADADTGDASTLLFTYERLVTPNIGIEAVIGIPPRIHADAKGSVAFLGDDILSAKFIAPTVFVNYHFGSAGDTWRPYAGVGINYTKFQSIRSRLADKVEMGDSTGLALQLGVDYALDRSWGLWASLATLKVKSKIVAQTPGTVLSTTIDFRPFTYQVGASYRF